MLLPGYWEKGFKESQRTGRRAKVSFPSQKRPNSSRPSEGKFFFSGGSPHTMTKVWKPRTSSSWGWPEPSREEMWLPVVQITPLPKERQHSCHVPGQPKIVNSYNATLINSKFPLLLQKYIYILIIVKKDSNDLTEKAHAILIC